MLETTRDVLSRDARVKRSISTMSGRLSQVDLADVLGFETPAPPRGPPPVVGVENPALREVCVHTRNKKNAPFIHARHIYNLTNFPLCARSQLIQTEVAYVADLDLLCDVWKKPLRDLAVLPKADERRSSQTARGCAASIRSC